MNRIALAGALALGLSSAACTPEDLTSIANAATVIVPNLPADASVPQVLAGAGVTPAGQAAIATNIARVQVAAAKICSEYRPLAASVLNVGIALSRDVATVANSGLGQGIRGAATIICNGLQTAPTYTALGNRKGERVRVVVHLNGYDVPVYAERLR